MFLWHVFAAIQVVAVAVVQTAAVGSSTLLSFVAAQCKKTTCMAMPHAGLIKGSTVCSDVMCVSILLQTCEALDKDNVFFRKVGSFPP